MTPWEGPPAAVIFDVDGVLLNLTGAEEDAFFTPFEKLYGLTGLSRDWDSYRVRNDEDIIEEILSRHFDRPLERAELEAHCQEYYATLEDGYASGRLEVELIPGAHELLETLDRDGMVALGIATANLVRAAEIRLRLARLWHRVCRHTAGADGGGPKRDVLARVISGLNLPPDRIVYVGDNLNDFEAGLGTGVRFIGFAVEETRRERLLVAGAPMVSADHATTLSLIEAALAPPSS